MRPASNMQLEWRTLSRLPFEVRDVVGSHHIHGRELGRAESSGASLSRTAVRSVARLSFCGVANVIDTDNVDRSAGTRLNLRIKVVAE
ncbi:hypothetical protein ACVMB1_000138 [Bradyrhizobium sp. USDA 4504]